MSQIPVTDHLIALNQYISNIHMDWIVNFYYDYHLAGDDLIKCNALARDLLSTVTDANEPIGKTARQYAQILNAEVLRDSKKASFLYENPISLFCDVVDKALDFSQTNPTDEEFEKAWTAMKIAFPEFMREYHEKKSERHPGRDEVTFWFAFLEEFAKREGFYNLCQKHFVPFLEKHGIPTQPDDDWYDDFDDHQKTQEEESLDFLRHLRNSIHDKVDYGPQIQNEEYKREVDKEIAQLKDAPNDRPIELAQKTLNFVRDYFQNHQPNVDEKRLLAPIFARFPDFPEVIQVEGDYFDEPAAVPQTFNSLPSLIYNLFHKTGHPNYIVEDIDRAEEELPGLKGIIYGGLYERFGKNHPDSSNPNWGPDHIGEYLNELDEFRPAIIDALQARLAKVGALEGLQGLYAKIYAYEKDSNPGFNTDNPNWGEENAFKDLHRLIAALQVVGTSEVPYVSYGMIESEDDNPYSPQEEAFGRLCRMIHDLKSGYEIPENGHVYVIEALKEAEEYLPGLQGEIYGTLYANFGDGSQDPEWGPNNLSLHLDQLPFIFPGILEELLKPKLSEEGLLEGENGLYAYAYKEQCQKEPGFRTDDPQWGKNHAFDDFTVISRFLIEISLRV